MPTSTTPFAQGLAEAPGAQAGPPLLFTAGTPFARWLPFASALLRDASGELENPGFAAWLDRIGVSESAGPTLQPGAGADPPAPAGGIDARAVWVLDHLVQRHPKSQFLMFIDGPAHAVAQWLQAHPVGDVAQALQQWCGAAQRILHHVHSHPARCLLIDTEEAIHRPDALRSLLTRRLCVEIKVAADAAPLPAPDALALALASGLAREMRQAQTLFAQLQASCMPLTDDDLAPLAVERVDHAAAVQRWRDLVREATMLGARVAAGDAARAGHEQALAALQRRADDAQREADNLLVQLHQTQEELEGCFLGQNKATAQVDTLQREAALAAKGAAEAAAELQASRLESDLLLRQLHTVQEELDKATAQLASTALLRSVDSEALSTALAHADRLQREAASAAKDAAAAAAELQASRLESDALLRQLHTVQEELEHHFLALKQLDSQATATRSGQSTLKVGSVVVGDVAHAPPHHHIEFDLHRVQTPYRTLARATVRLVLHLGRPGLVLLAAEDRQHPVAAWHAGGQEAGREWMALLPADAPSRARLDSLATGDWLFVIELAALLRQQLGESSHPEAGHWQAVAARLEQQLAQLPPRLRYSRLQVKNLAANGAAPRLELRFEDVVFGNEARADVQLQWSPGPLPEGAAPLVLQAPGDPIAPPLAGWPVDDNGQSADGVPLPVGPGRTSADKRGLWSAHSPGDREFVLALLDALPACAEHAADGDLPGGLSRQQLASAASALHHEARRTLRQLRLRQAVRSLLRRLRVA